MKSAEPPATDQRLRADSTAARIVGLIGADRPSRILAEGGYRPAAGTGAGSTIGGTGTGGPDTATGGGTGTTTPPGTRHPVLVDGAVCVGFLLLAAFLTRGLWPDPHTRGLTLNPADQILTEWFLSYGARVYAGDFALVTDRLNAPDGVNLLANPAAILLGVLLGPITLAFGAPVSFAVAVAVNLAATAAGWYLLFARGLGRHRFAAGIGATFAGFAPGLIAQSNGHLHLTAQWLVPAIVWSVLRLTRPAGRRRQALTGGLLGVLVALQYQLSAEVLVITGVAVALFCAAYAAAAWRDARSRLTDLAQGLGVAGGMAALLLAYPLWLHVAGPQHVRGGPYAPVDFALDVAGVTAISPLSLAGDRAAAAPAPEYNAHFGIPLLLVIAGSTLWLWRRPVAVATATAGAALVVLAFGPHLVVDGGRTAVPGPYQLISWMPGTLPTRFALAASALFAVLLVLAVDAGLAAAGAARLAVPLAVVAALAPIAPVPLPTVERQAVPRFFTDGYWRGCTGDGGVLVPVPPPEPRRPESMRWATAAGTEFALPEGYFVGPYAGGGRASLGTLPRPTSRLLAEVARTGRAAVITDRERADAAADIAFWRTHCFVLAGPAPEAALLTTMERLLGPPQRVAGVYLWRVGR